MTFNNRIFLSRLEGIFELCEGGMDNMESSGSDDMPGDGTT